MCRTDPNPATTSVYPKGVDWERSGNYPRRLRAIGRFVMGKHRRKRVFRFLALVIGGSLLTIALSGCDFLPVTVNSVIGTYEPYDPMLTNEGIPAEEVDFTVGGSPSGELVCLVVVFDDSGQRVGSTIMTTGAQTGSSDSVNVSVAVDITGDIFNGTPANAVVHCGTRAVGPTNV